MNEKRPRTNEQIRVPEVLLVSDDGAEKVLIADALARAKALELDLIEIAPKGVPPVVKIGDIGQYMYQVKKKERKQRAHSKQTEVKTLRFGFRTDRHDLDRLTDRAREFFAERHLVKFVVRLRGRELTNKSYAKQKLESLVTSLANEAEIESEVKQQGTQYIVVLRGKR
ncbi:MAG: translation initiation factor IF-3 [Candidatus Peregrinibacteria bacterium]